MLSDISDDVMNALHDFTLVVGDPVRGHVIGPCNQVQPSSQHNSVVLTDNMTKHWLAK